MLLILMIRLQLLLVRRRVLGTDQGMRGPVALGPEVQVAFVLADPELEMAATILPHAEPMDALARICEEPFQLGAVGALAGDRGRAAVIGRFLRGSSRERFQLLPARG